MTDNNIGLDYNTSREKMAMPEYGRNVLRMVESLRLIEDKAKRSEQARAIIKVMEILNPQVHQQEDYEHRLWDQLYIIAGFDLDIDSPYPCPQAEVFSKSPVSLPMKDSRIKAAHYGRNIEKIINLLKTEPDGEVKTEMLRGLATYMRQQYLIWNKDSVADETIFHDIEKLSEARDYHSGRAFSRQDFQQHQLRKAGTWHQCRAAVRKESQEKQQAEKQEEIIT